MSSNNQCLPFTILLLILQPIPIASGGETLVAGWTPIKNLSDPTVVDVGKYAVARHNFAANTRLLFDKLVDGSTRSRTRTDYNLTIAAKDVGDENDGTLRNYVAIVYAMQDEDFMHLVSFRGPV